MRVLNVLRHWITKHPLVKSVNNFFNSISLNKNKMEYKFQDFSENQVLRDETLNLVNDILNDENITDTEQKVAYGIIQQLNDVINKSKAAVNILKFLATPSVKLHLCII